jgi:hypothetical protein
MKFKLHNPRRRRSDSAPSISLFPFLAVLICTMGALVPLLFAITRQARLQAAQTAGAKIAEKKAEIQTEHETMQWRIGQLKGSRTKTGDQVADARLELGHLEDHARSLREKIPTLEKTVAELERLDSEDNRQQAEKTEELEKLRSQIRAAKKRVTDAQIEAASRKKSYAIVPYEGPNQTYRRPIYLECRSDAVVLQPEGIELSASDFDGPLGPGNPLAAALRAVREYLLSNHGFDPQHDGEPYPLLLVRPEGIAAYYAARAAMTSWGADFGYELIEADWRLTYQPPDAQLVKVVQDVLASSRARQQRLVAAAPAAYSKKSKSGYRAPSRGGSAREGRFDLNDDSDDSGALSRQTTGRAGRGFGSPQNSAEGDSPGLSEAEQVASLYGNAGNATSGGNNAAGANRARGTMPGDYGGGNLGNGAGYGGNGYGGGPSIGSRSSQAYGFGNANSPIRQGTSSGDPAVTQDPASSAKRGSYSPAGNALANTAPNGGDSTGDGSGQGAGYGNGSAYGGSATGSGNFTGVARGGTGDSRAANSNPAGGAPTGGGNQPVPGQEVPNASAAASEGYVPAGTAQGAGNSKGKTSGKQIGSTEGYIAGQPPSEKNLPDQTSLAAAKRAMSDPNQPNAQVEMPLRPGEWRDPPQKPPGTRPDDEKDDKKDPHKKRPKDLAAKRGEDWALPDAARGSVPVTRPIKVECRPDQLVVFPESDRSEAKTVPLGSRTEVSTDAFISAVWEHMDAWGIAGRGMYWRPILNVYVAPGAEQRFADLQALLAGSGLKVVRK